MLHQLMRPQPPGPIRTRRLFLGPARPSRLCLGPVRARRLPLPPRSLVLAICAFTVLLLPALGAPSNAHAWANGGDYGNGFGTHDWVLYEANRLAGLKGYHWVALSAALKATDNPDTKLHDTYHHVYDVWGTHYGDAPDRIQTLFTKAVSQLHNGNRSGASYTFGLLAHYYADICNPTHTDSRDREAKMHSRHEDATNTRTDSRGEHRTWVRFNGVDVRSGGHGPATRAATYAHQYYLALVDGYIAHGWSTTTARITRRCLNRAVNDLADLIVSVRKASR